MAIIKAVTAQGTVVGVRANNRGYTVFRGIPYAAPPVGELRFAPPQPAIPWTGERICDKWPNTCMQAADSFGHYAKEFYPEPKQMSEDCLYLNIWTPANSAEEALPVFFWIHGGAYLGGYSYEMEFDGEAMCKRGCILVSIEYRCNSFGFLAHPRLSARWGRSGNQGMLDQAAALKWVHDNIAAFGGDPGNITVHGQSAGAMSTKTLLTSPLCKGLMNRAIIQSGGGLNDWSAFLTMAEQEAFGEELLKMAGMSFDEAMTLPAQEVYDRLTEVSMKYCRERGLSPMVFRPCIDDYALFAPTGESMTRGEVNTRSIMCGSVEGDSGLQGCRDADPAVRRAAAYEAQVTLGHHYAKDGGAAIYAYFFERHLPGDELGAWHSAELWYMFGSLHRAWRPWTGYDYVLSDAMVDYWCNFARCGDPNGGSLPHWPAFTADTPKVMNFTDAGFEAAALE